MTTTALFLHDPRLSTRLRIAVLVAAVLHAAVLIAVHIRASRVEEPRPPLTVQLIERPTPPPPPAKPSSRQAEQASTPAPAVTRPAAKPRSEPSPQPPTPAPANAQPLPRASQPTATRKPAPNVAAPVPKPVIANKPPPPPTVSPEQAAASAQKLAQAALQRLAPTPSAGEKPTTFGDPVGPPAATEPVPVSSSSEANIGRVANSESSRGATTATLAALDQALASASRSAGGSSSPGAGSVSPGVRDVGTGAGGSGDFSWDDPGAGCQVVANPDPETTGIVADGMTYHIKVRFRVDPSGLVTSAQITEGSGNSALDAAVLSAARRMSFACNVEAHGVKSYRVS